MSEPHQSGHEPRRGSPVGRFARHLAPLWIGGVFALTLGVPLVEMVRNTVWGAHDLADAALTAAGWAAIGRTCAYAGAIALLAVMLAVPAAMAVARARPVWQLILAAPMLLPSYLAYAAWSIARAPTTQLGRWIAGAPERGQDWLPLIASRGLAVWGLALWVWPLAAIVIASSLRATSAQFDDPLRLDCVKAPQRWRARLGAALPGVFAAWVLVALLMLGSAVPLHVARIQTYAIRLWTVLDSHPTEPWRAWLASWPLAVLAAVAGWTLSGKLVRMGAQMAELSDDSAPRAQTLRLSRSLWVVRIGAAAAPWLLSVLVPLGLFWCSMDDSRMLGVFLERAGSGVATSLGVGAAVGAVAATTCIAIAQFAGSLPPAGPGRVLTRWLLAACLAWTLLPGVLTGSAVAATMRLGVVPDAIEDSALPMVVAHVSRCLFLPVLVGLWLAAGESRAIGDSRCLDGATGPIAWAHTALGTVLGPSVAVGLACLCLSVHEIESSLQVQSPGIDHLAQRLLQWLHYERTSELSAAGVLLLGLGVVGSSLAVILAGRPRKRTRGTAHR